MWKVKKEIITLIAAPVSNGEIVVDPSTTSPTTANHLPRPPNYVRIRYNQEIRGRWCGVGGGGGV